jgi:hypothetical protein
LRCNEEKNGTGNFYFYYLAKEYNDTAKKKTQNIQSHQAPDHIIVIDCRVPSIGAVIGRQGRGRQVVARHPHSALWPSGAP